MSKTALLRWAVKWTKVEHIIILRLTYIYEQRNLFSYHEKFLCQKNFLIINICGYIFSLNSFLLGIFSTFFEDCESRCALEYLKSYELIFCFQFCFCL